MKKTVALCLSLVALALAQKQSVVVLPSLDLDSKLTPKQKDILMEEVRTIAAKLPQQGFFLMKQDEVNERLGDEAVANACAEGTCVGNLIKQLQANFGARCEVSADGNQWYLRFEIYGTLKGDNVARTVDQFNEPVKNFQEMLVIIKKRVPGMFEKITKSPQENCEADENIWENGTCITATQMAKEACENEGKKWHGGECKTTSQIVCEATKGKKWQNGECKTMEQIACEDRKGMAWVNGACKSQVATSAPATPAPVTPAPVTPAPERYYEPEPEPYYQPPSSSSYYYVPTSSSSYRASSYSDDDDDREVAFGLRTTVSINNIAYDEDGGGDLDIFGIGFPQGLILNIPLSKRFSIEPGLDFHYRLFIEDDFTCNEAALSVPLVLQLATNPPPDFALYVEAGVQFDFPLWTEITQVEGQMLDEPIPVEDRSSLDFGFVVGGGLSFAEMDNGGTIRIGYRYISNFTKFEKGYGTLTQHQIDLRILF